MRPWAHERPREVGGPDSGGTDPVGNTEAARTAAGAQEYLSPVAGPVNWKGSKDALLGPCNRLNLPEETVVLSAALEFLE
jgi:hypothetical protein